MIDYAAWPKDPSERRKMAREVLGLDIRKIHRTGIQAAEALLMGELPKRPTPFQVSLAEWAHGLAPLDRERLLEVVKVALESTLFDLLVTLDGSDSGSWNSADTEYKISLVVRSNDADEEEILLNPSNDSDLHEDLYDSVSGFKAETQ